MSHAAAMVGNSSSGIIEAASFHLPVVNIGDRQLGRERSGNVIDCGFEEGEIRRAISRATGDAFRDGLANLVNVYGDGHAGARIRAALEQVRDPSTLLQKKFHDYGDRTGSSPLGAGRMPLV
jgi:UDP-N-acetylglucosamine 2-epimerase